VTPGGGRPPPRQPPHGAARPDPPPGGVGPPRPPPPSPSAAPRRPDAPLPAPSPQGPGDVEAGGTSTRPRPDASEAPAAPAPAAPSTLLPFPTPLDDVVRRALGVEPAPELLAISLVYFVQGILGLSRLATAFFFKDELQLGPAEVALLGGISGIPWAIKPLYGFISDSFPLLGYKRRSYLVLCGLVGAGSWGVLAASPPSVAVAVGCTFVGSVTTAFSDVVADSLVVERARGTPLSTAGSLQSLCWGSSAVGGILSAYFSGSLVESGGARYVFSLTALFPLVVASTAALIDERRQHGAAAGAGPGAAGAGGGPARAPLAGVRRNALALWGAVKERGILLPAAFLFVWQATPSAGSAMFYFYTNGLGFSPEFMGRVALAGAVSNLAGIGVYNRFLRGVPLRRIFLWTAVTGAALSSTQLLLVTRANAALGLSDQLFVLGDSVVLTVLGQLSFMPVLVLAARVCPEGVEATLFATLMSLLNSGSFAGTALGSVFTKGLGVTADNFDNLAPLVALCCALQLLPLPLLGLIPEDLESVGGDRGADAADAEVVVSAGPGDKDLEA